MSETEEESALAKRLDRSYFADRSGPRSLLPMLAGLGAAGAPVGVGLIVGGVVMRGALGPSEVFAKQLDAAAGEAVDALSEEGAVELFKNEFKDLFARTAKANQGKRDADRKVAQKYVESETRTSKRGLDGIDAGDVAAYSRAMNPDQLLYLVQVQVQVGMDWVEVGAMEVRASSVSAWWPLSAEADTVVNYHRTGGAGVL